MQIKRNILLNPGPATTTDTVKKAQVVPDICPREKEFAGLMKGLRSDLLKVVHAPADQYTAVLFCGSGTINIDICLNSLLPEGKKVLVVNNGAYNTRAVEVCQMYHLPHIDLKSSVFEQPDLALVEKNLQENDDIAMVYCCHHETGTGVLNPIREIGALAHKYGAIFVSDTTSSLGMIPLDVINVKILSIIQGSPLWNELHCRGAVSGETICEFACAQNGTSPHDLELLKKRQKALYEVFESTKGRHSRMAKKIIKLGPPYFITEA